jgi:hypothetical protein
VISTVIEGGKGIPRETRAGWTLPTVETEANGDSRNMKGVLPSLVRWARCTGKRDFCSALAAPVGPVQNMFLTEHNFISFVPIAQQAGQVVLCRLSLNRCL